MSKKRVKLAAIAAAILALLVIWFIILPAPASSFNYDINEDGTVTVTFYGGYRPYVKIPEKIEGRTVTAVGYVDSSKRKSLMDNRSYEDFCIIHAVTLPNSVKIIGDDAFALLFNLSYINMPDSLEYIGNSAFWDTDIKSIDLPDSVKTISDGAFLGCEKLKKVKLPNGLEEINEYAFGKCLSLKKIDIPETVKVIRESAFGGCEKLADVTLPEGLERIEGEAFENTTVKELYLSENLTFVGASAFCGSPFDERFLDDEFEIINGKILYRVNSEKTEIHIPEGIECVGAGAFIGLDMVQEKTLYFAPNAEEIIFPSSVTTLENYTPSLFVTGLCPNSLKRITVPQTVESTDSYLFVGCDQLTEVTLESTADISSDMFKNCSALEEIVIPEGVKRIGLEAFKNCTALKKVVIPSTVEVIANNAFEGCTSLKTVDVPESAEIEKNAFPKGTKVIRY